MVISMKTTVEIPDSLFKAVKTFGHKKNMIFKEVLEAALVSYLEQRHNSKTKFKLKDASVCGRGLAPGLQEGDWAQIRNLAYEGRGG